MASGVNLLTIKPSANVAQLAKKLGTSKQLVGRAITEHLREYGRALVTEAKEAAPVKEGVLRDSIRYKVELPNSAAARLVVSAGNKKRPEVVVRSVMFGSVPHVIRPKRLGGVLRWIGRDGMTRFAKKVNHPGTVANKFFNRALQNTASIRRSLSARLGKMIVDQIVR